MAGRSEEIELLLARWELGLVPPGDMPNEAIRLMEGGCPSLAVAALAGQHLPSRWDVEACLQGIAADFRLTRPTEDAAFKFLVDHTAQLIVDGDVPPHEGAKEIWALGRPDTERWWAHPRISEFIFWAGEWNDDPPRRSECDAAILEIARSMLAEGGIQLDRAE